MLVVEQQVVADEEDMASVDPAQREEPAQFARDRVGRGAGRHGERPFREIGTRREVGPAVN